MNYTIGWHLFNKTIKTETKTKLVDKVFYFDGMDFLKHPTAIETVDLKSHTTKKGRVSYTYKGHLKLETDE